MSRYSRNQIGSVGNAKSVPQDTACKESRKDIKKHIARIKDDRVFILEARERDIFDYNDVLLALGRNTANLVEAKQRLKLHKGKK